MAFLFVVCSTRVTIFVFRAYFYYLLDSLNFKLIQENYSIITILKLEKLDSMSKERK